MWYFYRKLDALWAVRLGTFDAVHLKFMSTDFAGTVKLLLFFSALV